MTRGCWGGGGTCYGRPLTRPPATLSPPTRGEGAVLSQPRPDLVHQLRESHRDPFRHHDLLEIVERRDGGGEAADGGGDGGEAAGELDRFVGGGVFVGEQIGAGLAVIGEDEEIDVG